MMEDRKRAYSEQSSSSSDKSPPPKRQFLSSQQSRSSHSVNGQTASSSSSNSYQDYANLDISDPKWLELYQKEAIIRALREYKREGERINKWNEQLKEKQINYEDHLSVVNRCWSKLLSDLRMIISRVDEDGKLSSLIPSDEQLRESKFLAQILQFEQDDEIIEKIEESLTEKFGITKEVIRVLLEKIIAWIEQRNKLIKTLQSEKDPLRESKVIQNLKSENESLNLLNTRNQKEIDDLQAQHHTVSFENNSIKDELDKTKNRLEAIEERLENTKDELLQAEKRLDRSKSVTLGYWTHPGNNIFGPPSTSTESDNKSTHNNRQTEENLKQFKFLAESRLKELEDLVNERSKLKEEILHLREQIKNLPEDRIIESQVYRNLQVQNIHYKDNADYMRTVLEQNNREMEKMTATRNSATNQIQEETKQTIKEMEDQLNKLILDLDRIRSQRDDVSMEVDKLRAMLPQEFRQLSALRVLANDRKTIIRQLMTEIQRLNMKIAAIEGNKQAMDFYCTPAEPPDVSYEEIQQGKNSFELIKRQLSYDHHLQEELNKSEKKKVELQKELDELKNTLSLDMEEYHEVLTSEARLKQEVEELKSRLDEYDEKYGIKDPGDDPLHILTTKIEDAEKKIEKIESERDYLKNNEKQLLQELEFLGDHCARQDQENTVKVFEIIAHDEKLQNARESEAKVKQKLNSIWMENVSLKKQKNHLSTVIQNQTDLLRQKGYLEENLKSQLDNANKELACSRQVVDVHKLKLHEFTQQNKDLKEKIERNMASYNEISKKLEESTKLYEKEAHKSRRMGEEAEMYKRQVEDLRRTQVSDTTEQQLIQSYEKLLKCSSCAIRFKSHCLLKCMHTFCKECLEAQEKARNRKCAKCGLPFSSTDIKQLYH